MFLVACMAMIVDGTKVAGVFVLIVYGGAYLIRRGQR